MDKSDNWKSVGQRLALWALATFGLLLTLGLLTAAPARADIEQVANFADSGQAMQLRFSNGLAVNTTGAGGVPAGTVYAVSDRNLVARYNPDGSFSEAWGWNVSVGGSVQFERCGPDGEAAHPECKVGVPSSQGGTEGEGAGQLWGPRGVAVHQATGNVYVVNTPGIRTPPGPIKREHNVVEVFSADGSQIVTSFGDAGAQTETFDEGPEKLHTTHKGGIAVDESGTVYISDLKPATPESPGDDSRVMVFKPQIPGDFKQYVYTGRANDIDAGGRLAVDSDGDLFTASEGGEIYEFDLDEPDTPICEFDLVAGGMTGMTVNPVSGEPFYFSSKTKKIHHLSACNAEGKFVEKSSIPMTPKTVGDVGLAYNPNLPFSPTRPAGTLYAASWNDVPGQAPGETILGIGYIFAPAEVFPPSVESQAVSSVTSSTAVLNAQINPKGSETHYIFQYLTEAEYEANEPGNRFAGASEAPLGGGVLESAPKPLTAASAVVGLLPDTEYRYRVIAASHCEPDNEAAVCEDTGADATFRTFPVEAPGLPDNRAYELVSPMLKNGGEVFPLAPEQASCGLECKPGAQGQPFPRQSSPDGEAVVYEGQPFSLTEGATIFNQYISKRTPTGWQTTILAPRLMGSNLQGYKAFDAELTTGILLQGRPSLTPEAPSETNNLYTQPTANPAALTPLLGSEPPNRGQEVSLAYAGASADFSRHFIAANDALTGATAFAPEALDGGPTKKNLYESVGGELRLVNVLPGNAETVPGAHFGARALNVGNFDNSVSNLSDAISENGSRVFWSDEAGQVYVRENGETTTEIPDPGKFLSAAADGSKVLLRNGHLFDLETEGITDLTEGQGGFEGIVGQSEDLAHVYFVATAVLTGEEENQYGAKAEAGKFNLYSWQGGSSTFVATLDAFDENSGGNAVGGGDWHFSPAQRTAQASPNGRWVAFRSRSPLTGYDNVGPNCPQTEPCREVFLYDSATAELRCPSCNPSHQAPLGHSSLPLIRQNGIEDPIPHARYLTDEGRLYFDSQDSLNPFDTNNGVEDVYQYEPQGVGSCKREGGCVSLISAGTGIVDSNFQAIDETGKSVFFTSRDQLLLRDRDELIDLYVAREGGGIPAETETGRGECQGEACLPAVAPPNDPTPGSLTFQGAGNVDEPKPSCKKQKKKKKRAEKRCAKKQKKHNRAAKQNRGGAR